MRISFTKVVEEDGRTTTYTYDGMGKLTHMDYPDGWQEDYHYDTIGQLTAIEDTDPSGKDMKQRKNVFEYDDCGSMTCEYVRGNGTGEATTEVFYTYNELNQHFAPPINAPTGLHLTFASYVPLHTSKSLTSRGKS